MMKYILLLLFLFSCVIVTHGQTKYPRENVVFTSEKKKTMIHSDEKDEIYVNVPLKEVRESEATAVVRYSDFGARGDGKTDDIEAIIAAHEYANQHDLPVRADDTATYYIGGKERTAVIRTDTDFGTANFIIDDTDLENRSASVFMVTSSLEAFPVEGISSLKRNQKKIDVSLPGPCLITVTNFHVKHYILSLIHI